MKETKPSLTESLRSCAPAMPGLPGNLQMYKETPQFNESTIPKGFLKEHSTKAGTWGVLRIESGSLVYVILERGYEATHRLDQDNPGVIEPCHVHRIEATADVSFHVEFYREDSA